MYDGTPQLRLEGDVSAEQIRAGKVFLERIQSVRNAAGVSTFAGQTSLGNGAYVYALTSGPIHVIQIVAPPVLREELIAIDGTEFPFLGGVVFGGYIKDALLPNSGLPAKVTSTFAPTVVTQRNYKLSEGKQNTQLLNVLPFFDDLKKKNEGGFEFSQYTMLKPTMFTGAMKFVVQCLMSFGRQKIKMTQADASKAHITYVANNGYRVKYDYRFAATHGIVFGADGVPWLTEISVTNGVIMMPLPRFSWSKTASYYQRVEAKGEHPEILAFLDLFGGLPTGELFPADLATAIKNGEVLQPIKPDDPKLVEFYACSAFSSVLGWAFNVSGTEARNTGYYLHPEHQVFFSAHYKVALAVGAINKDYKALKQPIAVATVSIEKVEEGPLLQFTEAPLFAKFYEPLLSPDLGGLLSLDVFPPAGKGRSFDADCETAIHVFFVGDQLKIVRFFRDASFESKGTVTDEMPACPYGGSWRVFELHIGTSQYPTQFFSNDWDKRAQVSDSVQTIDLVSNDKGYALPYFTDRLDDPDFCDVLRDKVFEQVTTSVTKTGEQHRSVVIIPQGMREAYYIGHEILIPEVYTSVSRAITGVTDPNVGVGFRKLFARDFGPAAGCRKGSPTRIIVDLPPSAGGGCSEVADGGPWLGMCQDVEDFSGSPVIETTSSDPPTTEVFREVQAALYSCSEIPDHEITVSWESFENHWMTRSPDPATGVVQYISVGTNTFGADSTFYQPSFNEVPVYTGPTVVPPGNDGNLTFVGVVT